LFDETRHVGELEHLTEVAEVVAAAESLEALGPEVVARSRELLGAEAVHVYLLDAGDERLRLRWSTSTAPGAPPTLGLTELGPELGRSVRARGPR
jgi:hypothetical protein